MFDIVFEPEELVSLSKEFDGICSDIMTRLNSIKLSQEIRSELAHYVLAEAISKKQRHHML